MPASIKTLELSNERGQICDNKVWADSDLVYKMGAPVDVPNPDYVGPDETPDVDETIKEQRPATIYLSITSNCKSISITKANPASGYDSSILDVNESEWSVTFKKPGKCMITIVGGHHDGSTTTKTWKFDVKAEDWTQDTTDPTTGIVTKGDYPTYVDRDPVNEITPSGKLEKVGDILSYEVFTNALTYNFSTDQGNGDKVLIDNKKNTVKGLKGGKLKIMAAFQFRMSKAVTWETSYTIADDKPIEPEDTAIVIQLFNKATSRTTKIATSNNASAEDVVFVLPEESGTLVTDADLKKNLGIIEKPSIIEPLTGTTEHTGDIVSSPFTTIMGMKDTHVRTTWQVGDNETFDKIMIEKVENITDRLTKFNPAIMGGVKAWVRCRYHSEKYDSFWSDPVEVTFGGHGWDSLKNPIKYVNADNPMEGTYYGIVPHSELVDDYDYRGTYNTIKNAVTVDGSGNVTKGKDYGQNMKKGYQVLHPKAGETKVSLWYAKKAMDANIFRQNPPGADSEYWALDERDNLCTPYNMVDRVGVGIIDPLTRVPFATWNRNADGYSTGPNMLGALENHTEGWLKFGYNGKILYTTKKPLSRCVAWTDLAKRDVVYGNRTLRIGRRLYWVRLLTEDEYRMLFNSLTNGKFEQWTEKDLMLEDKCWIEDFQETAIRFRMTGKGTRVTSDPKYREGSWRPVLELIPEGAEPYNNLPDCPKAQDEVFQYDPYSDTGYFGHVTYDKFMKADAVMSAVGYTGATQAYLDAGYLKFYWHGRILYIMKKTCGYNAKWRYGLNCHCVHGVDMGGVGKKTISLTHNGKTLVMPVSFPLQARMDNWTQDKWDGGTQVGGQIMELNKQIMDLETGRYSMWQELFYRIGKGYFGFTETAGSDEWVKDGYMQYHGGYQTGDNWAEYPTTELQVKYDSDGNGNYQWGRDIGTNKRQAFNRDSSSITWPAEPTNPNGPDGQPVPGQTTDTDLTEWCNKYGVDKTWFTGKYKNWATVTITEKFVQSVANVEKEARKNQSNYTGPDADRVNYYGYCGVARWIGGHDFDDSNAGSGVRLVCVMPVERTKIVR